jgi:hypothetical protein
VRVVSGRHQGGYEVVMIRDYTSTTGGQSVIVRLKLDAGNTDVFAPERLELERAESPH